MRRLSRKQIVDRFLAQELGEAPAVSLSRRRVVAWLFVWLLLTGSGVFHVYLRFLARDLQLERGLLVKKQEELHRRQLLLESELAIARREVAERMANVQAVLGLVEIDPARRVETELPPQLVAKYLPAAPTRGYSSASPLVSSAQAGQLEVPTLVQAFMSVIEANRAAARSAQNNPD